MSKEIDTLNLYIEQQLQKIKELTQTVLILETKNKLMQKQLEDMNSKYTLEKTLFEEKQFKRNSFNTSMETSDSRVVEKEKKNFTTVQGFSLKKKV